MPKNKIIGMIATTPISPKSHSRGWLTHHKAMVARVEIETNHWTPVNLSLTGRIGTIVVPLPGWKDISRRIHIRKMEMIPTGRTIKNQAPHEGCGCMI